MELAREYPARDVSASGYPKQTILYGVSTLGKITGMKKTPARELLSQNIRHYMAEQPAAGTQEKLARRAGISQSSVNRMLAAKTEAALHLVDAVACAFGVTPADMLTDRGTAWDASLRIDRQRFAQLPDVEKQKIASYIDFVLTQAQHADRPNTLTFVQSRLGSGSQRDVVSRAAQRELSDKSLSENEQHDQETPDHKGRP